MSVRKRKQPSQDAKGEEECAAELAHLDDAPSPDPTAFPTAHPANRLLRQAFP